MAELIAAKSIKVISKKVIIKKIVIKTKYLQQVTYKKHLVKHMAKPVVHMPLINLQHTTNYVNVQCPLLF